MKLRLVELLRCPACRGRLSLSVFSRSEEEVAVSPASPACRAFCTRYDRPVAEGFEPDCQACYRDDVAEGVLDCAQCQLVYPVIAGVPRLVRTALEDYAAFFERHRQAIGQSERIGALAARLGRVDPAIFDRRSNESFSLQWQRYQYEDKTWFKDDLGLRRKEFLFGMDLDAGELRGALLLDAGCGNGRLTAAVGTMGCEIVGMDLSSSIERANENRKALAGTHAPFVHFVQGNVMEPPLAEEAFDHLHSSGVLHHTPDTERAFRSLIRLGRPGAHVYVQLYRTREAWVGVPNRIIRTITSRLPVRMLYALCYAMAPVHRLLVLGVARVRGEDSPIRDASLRERAVSLFDNYSPRYQYRYRPAEVAGMFTRAGLLAPKEVTLENERRHMVAFVGTKPQTSGQSAPRAREWVA